MGTRKFEPEKNMFVNAAPMAGCLASRGRFTPPTSSPFTQEPPTRFRTTDGMIGSPKVNRAAASFSFPSLMLEIGYVEDDKTTLSDMIFSFKYHQP